MTELNSSDEQYQELQALYLKWHNGKRPLSGFIREQQALIERMCVKARIGERHDANKRGYDPAREQELKAILNKITPLQDR